MRYQNPRSPAATASDASADAGCDFEQLESDRSDGHRRQARPDKDVAPKVCEEQQGEAVQLQPERVRAEAVTAEQSVFMVRDPHLIPLPDSATPELPVTNLGRADSSGGWSGLARPADGRCLPVISG